MTNTNWIAAALLSIIAIGGCRTATQPNQFSSFQPQSSQALSKQDSRQTAATSQNRFSVQPANFQQDDADLLEIEQLGEEPAPDSPLSIASSISDLPTDDVSIQTTDGPAALAEIQQLALATNPAIAEFQAEIDALRGTLVQEGLLPNPTVGMRNGDINEDGGGGRYGFILGRKIIRGNKLALSQSVVCAQIRAAEQRLAMMQTRLLTDVRQRYYDALVAQETARVARELVAISESAVSTSEKLFQAKEAAQTSVLQAEVELQNSKVVLLQADNTKLAAYRKLAALIGEESLPTTDLDGNPRDLATLVDFEQSFDNLVNNSPEIEALFAEVEAAKRQLDREMAEPIPDVSWMSALQFETVSDTFVAGLQISMPLPTSNRNQGAIQRAIHDVIVSERRAEKKVLDLRQRLATAYEAYLDAKLQLNAYDQEILPKAKMTLELISKGYKEGEIDFLQLLTSQRTYSELNLAYLAKLQVSWRQVAEIRGLLLSGSLN